MAASPRRVDVALPCVSMSIRRTEQLSAARKARWRASVVLPTPPFWLIRARTRCFTARPARRVGSGEGEIGLEHDAEDGAGPDGERRLDSRSLLQEVGGQIGDLLADGAGGDFAGRGEPVAVES